MDLPNDRQHFSKCDESKCVSKGRSDQFGGSFSCYGDDGIFYPRMCTDGFVPVVVENEPVHTEKGFEWNGRMEEVDVRYFTCCPPDNVFSHGTTAASNATRRCSDPIVDASKACEDQINRKHPIPMRSASQELEGGDSTICCDDSTADNKLDTFLEKVECVPYSNEFYESCKIEPNQFGYSFEFSCEDPGGQFMVPRPLPGDETVNDVLATGFYQCCRTGTPLPQHVQDFTFWMNTVILPLLFFLSIIASLLVIIGLSVPLLVQLKDGTHDTASRGSARSRRKAGPSYSPYNLYLVYLAIPDLICSLFIVLFLMRDDFPPYLDNFFANATLAANWYLNFMVLHRIFHMLERSRRGQRVNQPTLKRVSMEAGIAYLIGIGYGMAAYYILYDFPWDILSIMLIYGMATFFALPPLAYGVYLGFLVYRRGYLSTPSESATARERAIRALAIYFFRIIGVFVAIWLPALQIWCVAFSLRLPWVVIIIGLALAIQPIATTCVILTNSDGRKHIYNLVTFYGVFGRCTSFGNKDQQLKREESYALPDPKKSKTAEVVSELTASGIDPNSSQAVSELTASGIDPISARVESLLESRSSLVEERLHLVEETSTTLSLGGNDEEIAGASCYDPKQDRNRIAMVLASGQVISPEDLP